ncbi:MAG: SDR family NAD(P)-dependent oxidoreductase [Gilvibacter sp.]
MKTILITGSTDGIGKLAANKLAKDGCQIILHGRNPQKLEKTISEVKQLSNNDNIQGYISDFSSIESIDKLILQLQRDYAKIDVLINNAGVFKSSIQSNQQGIDIRFAVNYFAPYYLTSGVLPLLKNSLSPRVINVSSAAQSAISLEALLGKIKPTVQEAYAQSKLALTMWSFEFAKEHPEIITIAVNPGSLLNTKMANEAYGQHWSPATKGSDILYELSTSDEYTGITGKYFDNDKGDPKGHFSEAHSDAYNQDRIDQLISATRRYLG